MYGAIKFKAKPEIYNHMLYISNHYTCLLFGIASAPAIFQCMLDSILQGISHVLCYIHDIIIRDSNDHDHFQNLSQVLNRLEHRELNLKR